MVFTPFGYLVWEVSQWTGTQPASVVFTLYMSKIEVCETYFVDILATHNGHPSYAKHVLGSIYVFFPGLRCVCHLGVHCSG